MSIRFDNDTQNFETKSAQGLCPLSVIKTNIVYNHASKRLGIPQQLKKRFMEYDSVMLIYDYSEDILYIDLKPDDEPLNDNVEYKLCKVRTTGRGYYVTIPHKWVRNITPQKAQLVVQDTKKSLYKVNFYD